MVTMQDQVGLMVTLWIGARTLSKILQHPTDVPRLAFTPMFSSQSCSMIDLSLIEHQIDPNNYGVIYYNYNVKERDYICSPEGSKRYEARVAKCVYNLSNKFFGSDSLKEPHVPQTDSAWVIPTLQDPAVITHGQNTWTTGG